MKILPTKNPAHLKFTSNKYWSSLPREGSFSVRKLKVL